MHHRSGIKGLGELNLGAFDAHRHVCIIQFSLNESSSCQLERDDIESLVRQTAGSFSRVSHTAIHTKMIVLTIQTTHKWESNDVRLFLGDFADILQRKIARANQSRRSAKKRERNSKMTVKRRIPTRHN